MGKAIVICNHKGGVGKTTLSSHLAAYGEHQGDKVLAIDSDPQGSLTKWAQRSTRAGKPSPEVRLMHTGALLEEFEELRAKVDWLVIDTAPAASVDIAVLLLKLLKKDDLVVVPVLPGGFELDSLKTTIDIVPLSQTQIVVNRVPPKATRASEDAVRQVQKRYPGHKKIAIVHDYDSFRRASLYGGTAIMNYRMGPAASDIRRLGKALWS